VQLRLPSNQYPLLRFPSSYFFIIEMWLIMIDFLYTFYLSIRLNHVYLFLAVFPNHQMTEYRFTVQNVYYYQPSPSYSSSSESDFSFSTNGGLNISQFPLRIQMVGNSLQCLLVEKRVWSKMWTLWGTSSWFHGNKWSFISCFSLFLLQSMFKSLSLWRSGSFSE